MKKKIVFSVFFVLSSFLFCIYSEVNTYKFAQKGSQELYMDVYSPKQMQPKNKCMIYVFGGGFAHGERNNKHDSAFCQAMADRGFVSIAIDYRLGLKNAKNVSATDTKPLEQAISYAVEDLFSATQYVIENADKLGVDTSLIMIAGSSAGAVTVLQADYQLSNRTSLASMLPPSFRYASVVSFSGAVFSVEGKPTYKRHPDPTLFFHGTKDGVVPYNQIRVFKKGLFGSSALAKLFLKNGYNFQIFRFENYGHEIAVLPMIGNLDDINTFFERFALEQLDLQIDISFKNKDVTEPAFKCTLQDIYTNKSK